MSTNIAMVDLAAQHAELREEIDAALREVMDSGAFIRGPNVQAFESEAAAYLGVRHTIGVASGTDALVLSLLAAGVEPGDEVITTPFTFFATAEAIHHVGASPVFVDIDESTFNLSPDALEAAIGERTRAVLPVHLYGLPADMQRIGAIARRHRLAIVEDCAQSFGATLAGRQTGSFGVASAFSFYPSKNLGGCGDGGLIATDSDDVAERIRRLGNHGQSAQYLHTDIGYNSRLDEFQAAILRIKLRRLDDYNRARRRAAAAYTERLVDLPLRCPIERADSVHIYHQYTVLAEERDRLREALSADGIPSAVHYPLPLHRQPVFEALYPDVSLPVSEEAARRCLSLPMHPHLDDGQIDRVVRCLAGALGG